MSTPTPARKRLPARPSEENLKKQAKRRAKPEKLQLAAAQHALARDYGFGSWPKLMEHVRLAAIGKSTDPATTDANPAQTHDYSNEQIETILAAARSTDVESLKRLLDPEDVPEARDRDGNPLLSLVCKSDANLESRMAAGRWLIDAGARVRAFGKDGATALHWAARHVGQTETGTQLVLKLAASPFRSALESIPEISRL